MYIPLYSGGNDKWYFDFKVKYLHQYLTKSQIQYHHPVALWILHLMKPSYVLFDEILTKLEGKYKWHFFSIASSLRSNEGICLADLNFKHEYLS